MPLPPVFRWRSAPHGRSKGAPLAHGLPPPPVTSGGTVAGGSGLSKPFLCRAVRRARLIRLRGGESQSYFEPLGRPAFHRLFLTVICVRHSSAFRQPSLPDPSRLFSGCIGQPLGAWCDAPFADVRQGVSARRLVGGYSPDLCGPAVLPRGSGHGWKLSCFYENSHIFMKIENCDCDVFLK